MRPRRGLPDCKHEVRVVCADGQLTTDGLAALPALKPKLTVSPTSSGRPLRPHSQAFNGSQSMNQLRVTHPAVVTINGLNGTLALASKRMTSIFAKKGKELSAGRHSRSITADATTGSSSTTESARGDGQKAAASTGASAAASRSNLHTDTRERGATEKENAVYENAPSHNYRQPIPKSISCYNIKSQHAYTSADGSAADTTGHSAAQPESKAQQRKTILQASTTELLHYLSEYLYR